MMPLTTVALQPYCHPTTFTSSLSPSSKLEHTRQKLIHSNTTISRRIATIAAVNTILLVRDTIFRTGVAYSFDFRITVPDQTAEEAESVVRDHAQDLPEVKGLIDSQFWKDAQKAFRKSLAYLKQDIYTLIQAKPGTKRPQLRLLYSQLFNSVTRLDYAARSKDAVQCRELFDNIVVSLDTILTKLSTK